MNHNAIVDAGRPDDDVTSPGAGVRAAEALTRIAAAFGARIDEHLAGADSRAEALLTCVRPYTRRQESLHERVRRAREALRPEA
jgi:hypothetical protein